MMLALLVALAACTSDSSLPPAEPAKAPATEPTRPAETAPAPLDENAKIEMLLGAIGELQGASFIRNGSDHSAKEAAEHLRGKWRSAGSRVKSAQDFVEQIASKSSMTGEVYRIRLADGSVVNSGDWLAARLAELGRGS